MNKLNSLFYVAAIPSLQEKFIIDRCKRINLNAQVAKLVSNSRKFKLKDSKIIVNQFMEFNFSAVWR